MNLKYFPHFMRANYASVANESNEDLMGIGREFKKYLQEKFNNDMDKLEPIWNIDPKNVIFKLGHPFRHKGYHPALIIHFNEFIKLVNNEKKS